MAHGLSCSAACGIFLDQGSNPCLLHWQADSFFVCFFVHFLIYLFYFFIFGCIGSSLLTAGFSLVVASRGYSSLQSTGSRSMGFSSCGTWAQ